MFENISKGNFIRSGWKVVNEIDDDLICCNGRQYKENSEFIAYCFNLQQRYNISKLEEAVELVEKSINYLEPRMGTLKIQTEIEQLLKQIKKCG